MKAKLCHVDREKKQRKKQSSLLCIKNIYKLVHRRIKKEKAKKKKKKKMQLIYLTER